MTRKTTTDRVALPGSFVWMIAALCVGCAACSSELDPTSPEDAYLMFRDAMFAGDAEAVWGRVDPTTKEYFDKSYSDLSGMSVDIERYLPQADHRIAKRQSGVVLVRDAQDGHDLFLKVFTPSGLPKDEAYLLGSEVDEIKVNEEETFAEVVTRGGPSFYLGRSPKNEQWYVMLVDTDALKKSMAWLPSNQSALRQTVDDLIAEERAEREKIIAELGLAAEPSP